MRVLCVLLLAGPLVAQDGPPVAVVRGELVAWNPSGRFEIAARDREVYPCAFDEDTYLSGSSGRVSASDIRVGQRVEAVVDRRGEPGSCKALTLYVLMASRALRQADESYEAYRLALDRQRHLLDHIYPRGRLTISGIVLEHSSSRLLVSTRSDGRKELRLRDDTRYTDHGSPSDASMLEVNSMVFVRAGQGIDGRLEAYQVIHGQILLPD